MRISSAAELSSLLMQSSYRPASPWGPFEAFAVTALIVLLCSFLLPLSIYVLSPNVFAILTKQFGPSRFEYGDYPVISLIGQIVTTVLVVVAAGIRGESRSAVLSLGPPRGGYLISVILASLAYLILRFLEFVVASVAIPTPLPYHPIQQAIQPAWLRASEPWIKLVVFVTGAPVSEELLFRGFLLSALAKSRVGFWGAAVISNVGWTSIHLSLSWAPLLVIFVFGLLLSVILSRTGSIWPCILAHGMGNAIPALVGVLVSVR